MYIGQDFSPAQANESQLIGLDFVNDLPSGETISSASVACTVSAISEAADPSPSSRITGGPFISGTIVSFRFAGALPNATYTVEVVATTSGASILSLFSHVPGVAVF